MQPDQSPQQPQFSSDYLDQISAPVQTKTVSPFILWGGIGGLLLLIIIVVMAIGSGSGNTTSSLTSVAARFDTLQGVSEDAQENLQNSELRTLNSSLTLTLTNSNRDLAGPLKDEEIDLKEKKNKSLTAVATEFEELGARLEDARLNAVYDRTYAREMAYQLKTLQTDMAELYTSTRSKSLKTVLQTANTNLKPLTEGFSESNSF